MFCYSQQNYLSQKGVQQEIDFLSKRQVKKIATKGSEFFVVACKRYDKYYDIYCTSWLSSFKMNIPRLIEPDILRVLQIDIKDTQLSILSAKDSKVFIDIVKFEEWQKEPEFKI